MNIFISARYERREEMKGYMDFLTEKGHEVPCTWIRQDQMDFTGMDSIPMNPGEVYAWKDYFEIKDCDLFISFTEKLDAPKSRGGRHVEFGFAWVMEKPVLIIGPSENVFHSVNSSDVWRMDEWDEKLILEYIQQVDDFMYMSKPRRR